MHRRRILKDLIIRNLFLKKENLLKFCKFIYYNQYFCNSFIKYKLCFFIRSFTKFNFKNRCLFSGRSRSVSRKFKLSRIVFRTLGNLSYIPGITKF